MLLKLILSSLQASWIWSIIQAKATASSPLEGSLFGIQYIADIPYHDSDAGFSLSLENGSVTGPCTVIPYVSDMTADQIEQTIATFTSEDDVWSPAFLKNALFDRASSDAKLAEDVLTLLRKLGTETIHLRRDSTAVQHLPWGPCWLSDQSLHRVSRLYADEVDAFVMSTVPHDDNPLEYRPLGVSGYGTYNPASLSIAVPSRMYFKRTTSFPLAGLRVAVKDNTNLQGVRTGGSSRSYTRLYGPSTRTAPAVRRLLELGAVVVGKTKTTQFADTEWATADWVDFHAPFSPRADGYQSPSGSSAGSGPEWRPLTG